MSFSFFGTGEDYLVTIFFFLHFGQLLLLRLLSQSSEVEHNTKMSISFFDDLAAIFSHFGQLSQKSNTAQR